MSIYIALFGEELVLGNYVGREHMDRKPRTNRAASVIEVICIVVSDAHVVLT